MEQKLWARLPVKVGQRQRFEVDFCAVPTLRQLAAVKSRALHDPDRQPNVTNGDVLELLYTFRGPENKKSVIPLLHTHLIGYGLIPNCTNVKTLWRKINFLEEQFIKLKKNHNARCAREGSHQVERLNDCLSKSFYPTVKLQIEVPDTHSAKEVTNVVLDDTPKRTEICELVLSSPNNDSVTTSKNKENERPIMSDTGIQVSSPQIRTEGQDFRIERRVKRQLRFSNIKIETLQQTIERKDSKFKQSEQKRKELVQTVRIKKDKMVDLNNRVKQLSADLKKVSPLVKGKEKSEKELHWSAAVISELIDNNHELEASVQQLSSTLTAQKQKSRELQKRVLKLKTKKERVKESISKLCAKFESGENVEQCVGDICEDVCSLGGNKTLIKSLATAMRTKLPTKNKSSYVDHVALLSIELQNLGVPQASVGKVANACTKHLWA